MARIKKKNTPWPVFIAIVLAFVAGTYTGTDKAIFDITFYSIYDLLATLFINALTLVVVPLVSASIITGVAKIGKETSFGRLGLKTLSFYLVTTLIAVVIGILFVNFIEPGSSITNLVTSSKDQREIAELQQSLTNGSSTSFAKFLLQIIPSNVLHAFSNGEMLGLIFFSMLFGYAISTINSDHGKTILSFFQGVFSAMIKIAEIILRFLPIGVFCLVAREFAKTGVESFGSLLYFSLTVICGLVAFMFIALPILIKLIAKVNPWHLMKALSPALVAAFSTSSSSATLPLTIDCVEKRAGVSNRITSLVVPLGTSINMSGSALYECVAALFIAQAYGISLPIASQLSLVMLALFASIGVAGVPSGSLVATIIVVKSMGLPIEGIGLFLAVDRIMDMARTAVNVFSDSCCAVLVAATEGEKLIKKELGS